MAEYLAMRIRSNSLDYEAVVKKYPALKAEIDRLMEGKEC